MAGVGGGEGTAPGVAWTAPVAGRRRLLPVRQRVVAELRNRSRRPRRASGTLACVPLGLGPQPGGALSNPDWLVVRGGGASSGKVFQLGLLDLSLAYCLLIHS